ncbi:hypothetical protein DRW07_16155 [Alteromonas sediminis]|uniref:Peptidase M61 catalytic domain-containing protein n=1 Tax=Alteromonas sediminis TaxID=2259342 RepID=A0A3N5Z587_9ALTE|nr:hypothetical protein [Alteromonas sediminis]RPJ65434.1 hypothetical protein DRW07_16155 [Alteromonas sediminis]
MLRTISTPLMLAFIAITGIFFSSDTCANSPLYEVTFKDTERNQVHITAYLPVSNDKFMMTDAGSMPNRWADFVNELNVYDEHGKQLNIEKISPREWKIQDLTTDWVTLDYNIDLSHDEFKWPGGIDGVAFQTEQGIFATGRALFIMSDDLDSPATVKIKTPEAWSTHTPWQSKEELSFVVKHNIELSESMIMVGDVNSFTLDSTDLNVEFVLAGTALIEKADVFKRRAQQLLAYYTSLMGGLPQIPNVNSDGKMLVIINEHSQNDGEVIGSHISMLMNPDAPASQQLINWFLYAHEFFHLWNGKTLKVESPHADWFKEGVTNYYTLKGLIQTGIIRKEAAFMVTNHLLYQRYLNDSGLGEISPSDAAVVNKDGHWGLVYGGGFFAGLALDVRIREKTTGEKSLDDVLRHLYINYSGEDTYYNNDDLQKIIADMGITSHAEIFRDHVLGTDKIEIAPIFRRYGFDATINEGQLIISDAEKKDQSVEELHASFFGKLSQ